MTAASDDAAARDDPAAPNAAAANAAAGRPRLVLVGAPGAGKTTVGTELARRWGVQLCDTDQVVEAARGRTVADIFVDEGEATFRALEEQAVAEALSSCTGVVALGGGAVLSEVTRERLVGLPVTFLDVGLPVSSARVGLGANRPLLLGNVRGQLRALLDARRPLYEQVSAFSVDTDHLSVEQVADEVERQLS
ncbi:MAG: shikimate kinase [Nocardioidaceae bacterium]